VFVKAMTHVKEHRRVQHKVMHPSPQLQTIMNRSTLHPRRWVSAGTSGRVRAFVVPLVMATACAPLSAAAMGHFACSIVENIKLPGERPDHEDYLTHYTCEVTGGQLDGFFVNVSTRWEANGNEGKLLGSLGHARKGNATVVYETHEGTMKIVSRVGDELSGWDSTATAKVRRATGSAAHLRGKTFVMHGRLTSPGKFSIDAVLVERTPQAKRR
jgi:hypothetical protein